MSTSTHTRFFRPSNRNSSRRLLHAQNHRKSVTVTDGSFQQMVFLCSIRRFIVRQQRKLLCPRTVFSLYDVRANEVGFSWGRGYPRTNMLRTEASESTESERTPISHQSIACCRRAFAISVQHGYFVALSAVRRGTSFRPALAYNGTRRNAPVSSTALAFKSRKYLLPGIPFPTTPHSELISYPCPLIASLVTHRPAYNSACVVHLPGDLRGGRCSGTLQVRCSLRVLAPARKCIDAQRPWGGGECLCEARRLSSHGQLISCSAPLPSCGAGGTSTYTKAKSWPQEKASSARRCTPRPCTSCAGFARRSRTRCTRKAQGLRQPIPP